MNVNQDIIQNIASVIIGYHIKCRWVWVVCCLTPPTNWTHMSNFVKYEYVSIRVSWMYQK